MTNTSQPSATREETKDPPGAPASWPPIAAGIVLLLGAFLFSLGNCGLFADEKPSSSKRGMNKQDTPVSVRIAPAEGRVLTKTLTRTGEVKAERNAVLKARVGGTLAAVLVDLGDRVKKGQLLVRIEPGSLEAELRKQSAQVAVVESRVKKAKLLAAHHASEYERRMRLHQEAALSASELAQAKITADTAEADATLIVAEMRRVKAELESIRIRLADTEIRAPFSGRVASRAVDPGTTVTLGETLLSLVSEGSERITFSLPESDVHWVKPGQAAKVSVAGRAYPAQVKRVGASLLTDNRSLPVIAHLVEGPLVAEPDEISDDTVAQKVAGERLGQQELSSSGPAPKILPGMFVEVTLQTKSPPEATIVPVSALLGNGTEPSVYSVDGEQRVRTNAVQLVFKEGEYAAVLGLKADQPIVVAGGDSLRDGQKVEAIP